MGAFDNVSWNVLAHIVDSLPIANYLKSLLKSYITNRCIGFSFTDVMRLFILRRGCPQGSCVGPLLWLLVADAILKRTTIHHDNILSYADDFVIISAIFQLFGNSGKQYFKNLCRYLHIIGITN